MQAAAKSFRSFQSKGKASVLVLLLLSWAAFINGNAQHVNLDAQDQDVTSDVAVLTVFDDPSPPRMTNAVTSPNLDAITITFDEPVSLAGATFSLSGGTSVTNSEQITDTVIVVHLAAALSPNTSYVLTANGVKDLSGNAMGPPLNTITFTSGTLPSFPPLESRILGFTTFERFDGATLNTIQSRIDNGPPPEVYTIFDHFDQPTNMSDNYCSLKYGWFIPPVTGSYVFFTACNDPGRLYLSTDANPTNKKLIASEGAWSNVHEWTTSAGGSRPSEKRSDQYAATEWPSGNTIILNEGEPYYIEQRQFGGGGGDWAAATFKFATEPDPVNGSESRITGSTIFTYVDPARMPPSITQNPVGKNFNKGDTVSLTVEAVGAIPFTYQWYRNKVAIAGATAATYTINNADETAIGDYSVKVESANGPVNTFHADDSARLLMNGAAFLIEAEDFNYQGGQHLAIADVMPYSGNAYLGLKSVQDIDFNNNNDESEGSAFAYNRFVPTDANVVEMRGPADPPDYNRGSFTVSANYAIGWSGVADWQNYTRSFPKGKFRVFAGAARDGLDNLDGGGSGVNTVNMTLSKVTNPTVADGSFDGVEGGAQGLTKLGTFTSPGTGAWSSNDVIPLTDEAGAITTVDLDGLATLRVTCVGDQDFDYLLFYCTDCPAINITSPANNATFAEGSNVPITVSATASSGTINKVEYFANGSKVGESIVPPFSFTVPNVPKGAYTLYAVGTDSTGRIATSPSINVTVGTPSKVLFLHAARPSGSDTAIATHLKNRGFLVTDKGPPFATTDADGFQLVVISSSITSGDVGNKFLNTAVPEVGWEQAILDDQLMISLTDPTKRGTATTQTQLNILNSSHPLAAGLSGTVTIATSPTDVTWGTPEAGATVVATVIGQPSQAAVFAFDIGDTLSDGASKAPARRVHAFMTDESYSILNSDGKKLLDAAITWALGGGPIEAPQVAVNGNGSQFTVTWINGGTLEYTVALIGAETVWTSTGESDGSFTEVPNQARRFYRVKK